MKKPRQASTFTPWLVVRPGFATPRWVKHAIYERQTSRLLSQLFAFVRFIDLDVIIAVQDQPSSQQDLNSACFNVVTPARTYELMAHDEQEKLRCDLVKCI